MSAAYTNDTVRILIVDDDKDVRDILVKFFGKKKYEIDTASTGQEAIEKLDSFCPDIVLLDIKLPDVDGLQVLRYILFKKMDIGVIFITGDPEYDKDIELLGRAYDYITKPFDLRYLNTVVLSKVVLLYKDNGNNVCKSEAE
ncbi:MAG: response regulator [Candidatus Tantalella remota]|nr:response regulator [Candidatus Tantalella remota]